jgi:hypothetical protein
VESVVIHAVRAEAVFCTSLTTFPMFSSFSCAVYITSAEHMQDGRSWAYLDDVDTLGNSGDSGLWPP